jgi:hypothetical protein
MSNPTWEDGLRNPPEQVRKVELSRQERQNVTDKAIQESEEMLSLMLPQSVRKLYDMLQSNNEQTVLNAINIIFSRRIPKVAAKHVEGTEETIDSADVASLRESIVAWAKKEGYIND